MAAVLPQDSVIFADTSTENIGYAKEFWRAIDGNFDENSSLVVSGVDHRLHTASRSNRTSSNTRKTEDNIENTDEQPGLVSNRNEANRRFQIEEEEYVHAVLDQKKQQQDLMKKRRDERQAKETIRESSKTTFVEELSTFDVDDDRKDIEDEGIQAMKDIENFERMVKISNERRKEKQ